MAALTAGMTGAGIGVGATEAAAAGATATDWGAATGGRCTGLQASMCMLPFPNDYYTVPDAGLPTGRQVFIPAGAYPPPSGGTPFDPLPWEGNDGFSPGSTLLVHVPNLSVAVTGLPSLSDIGASLASNSPVVLLNATTGVRWPLWAEEDVTDANPATRLLIIHPARNLTEGDHYIVGLRTLKIASGAIIQPDPVFASVIDPGTPDVGVSPGYAAHLKTVVGTLNQDGVSDANLFLAWDFTVASTRNITAPALSMRDQTFRSIGRNASPYVVTKVVNRPRGQPSLAREVFGSFAVPSYLSAAGGSPGSVLTTGADGLPVNLAGHVQLAAFECEIPRAATPVHPAAIGYYGHGLFGSAAEVTQSSVPQFSNAYDYVFCGTDWTGLSQTTLALSLAVVLNVSNFPPLVDNLLQSLLNAQVLGNLLANPNGFAASPAFEGSGHRPLIRPSSGLVYYGNSEGGIMGGAFSALSTEVRRSVLGVPGMDYALLRPRSADFAPFRPLADKAYPDVAVQQVGFDLMQMLWDRADADGYAEQMTSGLPATPRHQVLLEEAFGDHQVANVTTETEARTIGARIHQPVLRPGRSNEHRPFWAIPSLATPSAGPALFVWDSGVPPAPLADIPPVTGHDPHGTVPRSYPAFWKQMDTFFRTGQITDPCGGAPCTGQPP
ncbi:MAG TPA: hypothetical protein VNG12_15415 [Acidimicrobiales bacterium]|nr:hypothetical protein [Acidimicrobiales bacterium]